MRGSRNSHFSASATHRSFSHFCSLHFGGVPENVQMYLDGMQVLGWLPLPVNLSRMTLTCTPLAAFATLPRVLRPSPLNDVQNVHGSMPTLGCVLGGKPPGFCVDRGPVARHCDQDAGTYICFDRLQIDRRHLCG